MISLSRRLGSDILSADQGFFYVSSMKKDLSFCIARGARSLDVLKKKIIIIIAAFDSD